MRTLLDLRLIRENPGIVEEMIRKRNIDFPLQSLLEIDRKRRTMIEEVQGLRQTKNRLSNEIASMKRKNGDASKQIAEMGKISERIAELDSETRKIESKFWDLMLQIPNIPHETVPVGADSSANKIVRVVGDKPEFTFEVLDHQDLGLRLKLIDTESAAKVAGSRFYYLRGDLVRLNYALIQLGLEFLEKKGFVLLQPPFMLRRDAMAGSIILTDFEDVIYKVDGEDLYLIGTSEHGVAAMHMNEILDGRNLPLRYTGVSPCFRKEAGAHGRDTKGIFRVHQFEKVEQFIFCKPQDSFVEHELMLKNAEEFYQLLGIPYRVVLLSTGDMGKVAAKTWDIEVWFPGQGNYREVVSCSNCMDYQARRLSIKYREKPHEESQFVHTLNSTLVATERTLAAIMENFQDESGDILVPEVLREFMNGKEMISLRK